MFTNAGIALFIAIMILTVGINSFVAVHLPIVLLASTIGVWLFYIQHQFERSALGAPDRLECS